MIKKYCKIYFQIIQSESLCTVGIKMSAEDHKIVHVLVSILHGLGGEAHVLEHLCVSVGILQSFSLVLDGRQSAVDLKQLLFVTLLPLQCLEGSLRKQTTSIFSLSLSHSL